MKKLLLFILTIFPMIVWADTQLPTKRCFAKVTVGEKAWHVIEACGKPSVASFDVQPTTIARHYDIYEYTVSEPICYTTAQSAQVICDKEEGIPIRFYFNHDRLHNIELGNAQINNLFLTFNQHVVLGDSQKMLLNLWGEPKSKTRKKLSLPDLEERWQYNEGVIIFMNGVVTQLIAKYTDRA